jgi:aminopeptidase N
MKRYQIILIGLWLVSSLLRPDSLPAQEPDDWTIPYRPALLPDFADEMADQVNAPRYQIDLILTVTPAQAVLDGHQVVTYTNRTTNTTLQEIVFRLYPNLRAYGGTLQVSHVTVGGTPAAPELDETRSILTIPLPTPLAPGNSATIEMDFKTTASAWKLFLYGQFSYLYDVLALPNAYPMLSVYEPGEGWWQATDYQQGDAVFSETAFYTVNIAAPADLVVAASGSEINTATSDDGVILTHTYVAPLMRDFALVASPHYVALKGQQDGVIITVYYDPERPQALVNAQTGLEIAQNSLHIFNTMYGRYPFAELDIVQTPNTIGGIEYPGLVVIADKLWDESGDIFEFMTVHEIAHQWSYSLVGSDQMLHPWIDEALAQYSVAVYIRELEGEWAYDAALDSFRSLYVSYLMLHDDQVIGLPTSAYSEDSYFYFVYQKGPLFYAALADTYGYETTLQMLQTYFAAYRYQIVEPGDMLSSFEETLGQDLDPLFQEWVGTFPVG